jgi:hypothetical protein
MEAADNTQVNGWKFHHKAEEYETITTYALLTTYTVSQTPLLMS